MDGTFVDIRNEFVEIAREVDHLSSVLSRLAALGPLDEDGQAAWEACHICASATEKIYTGCERIMARLAAEIDGAPLAHTDDWHLALLRRMARPFPDRRAAVISEGCYRRPDRLRAFRHRERNTYGINLDVGIVLERSGEAITAFEAFRLEVSAFFGQIGLTPGS